MKKLLTILFIFLTMFVQAQIVSTKVVRVKNNSTTFNTGIAKSVLIVDETTGKLYVAVNALAPTETIVSSGANVLRISINPTEIANIIRNSDSVSSYDTRILANKSDILLRLRITDTASMLNPYVLYSDTSAFLSPYLLVKDTTSMLSPYGSWINANTANIATNATAISLNTAKKTESTTVTTPLVLNPATYNISIPVASGTTNGYLSSADWTTFNSKLGSFIEQDPIFVASPAYGITTTDSLNISNLSGTNTGDQTLSSLGGQPLITTGTTSQYFRGDLSLATFPTSLPASDVYAWAKASVKPSYTTSEVTEGANLYYTDARVAANSAVVLNTAKVSDINHMTYPAAGIAVSTGSNSWGTSIADNSVNWNTAYTNTTNNSDSLAIHLDTLQSHNTRILANKSSSATNTANTATNTTAIGLNTAKKTESTTVTSPLALSGYNISIPAASGTVNGYLSSTDWTTFNNKLGSFTEQDPKFLASPAYGITSADSLNISNLSGVNTGDQTLSDIGGQPQLNGTGFVKANGTAISYDNSTYLKAADITGKVNVSDTADMLLYYKNKTASNTSNISTNSTDITKNIDSLGVHLDTLKSHNTRILANKSSSAVNASSISTNTTNIATNTTNIQKNVDSLSVHLSTMQSLNINININAGNIATNTSNIQSNTDSIAALRSSINTFSLSKIERFTAIQGQTNFFLSSKLTLSNLVFVNGNLADVSSYSGVGTDTLTFATPLSLYDHVTAFYSSGSSTSIYWYGVEWDTTVADPALTRIGNVEYQATLPIQSRMVRAVVNDNGTINYYLDPNNSNKKADGTTADLSGASGQVMVIVPTHWERFEKIGTKRRIEIATVALPGFTKVPEYAVGAYDAYYNSTTGKLESRSGVMPTTNITRANFRTYAAARGTGWHEFDYNEYKDIFYLYVTEYATFDIQSVIPGATNAVSADWSAYNGYNPVVANGVSNTYGNYSASVPFSLTNFVGGTGTLNSHVADYRGIENIYGHIWQFIDGVNIDYVSTTQANIYTNSDPSTFADDTQTGYTLLGTAPNASGWIRSLIDGSWLPATDVGASSSTYMTDYHYASSVQTGVWRVVLAGGYFNDGSIAGLLGSSFRNSSSYVSSAVGGRLCLKIQ